MFKASTYINIIVKNAQNVDRVVQRKEIQILNIGVFNIGSH